MPESVIPTLLLISLIVAAGLGAFEVSLALRSKQFLDMTPFQIGLMFIECSLVMFMAQAIVFYPIATYWVSMAAGKSQGRQLGRNAAAMSLGLEATDVERHKRPHAPL